MRNNFPTVLVLAVVSLASLCLGMQNYDLLYELVIQVHQPYIAMDSLTRCTFIFGKLFVCVFHLIIPALIFFLSVNKDLDLFWTALICILGCFLAHLLGILAPYGILIALPFVLIGWAISFLFRLK